MDGRQMALVPQTSALAALNTLPLRPPRENPLIGGHANRISENPADGCAGGSNPHRTHPCGKLRTNLSNKRAFCVFGTQKLKASILLDMLQCDWVTPRHR